MDGQTELLDVVSARWSSLYRLAWLLTGDAAAAERVLRGSLTRLHARRDRLGDVASVEDALRTVMVGLVVAPRRRVGWAPRPPLAAPAGTPIARTLGDLPPDRSLVWPLVCALPARQRVVLVLLHHEGLTEGQVADVLGCQERAVRSLHEEALAALARGLAAVDAGSVLSR